MEVRLHATLAVHAPSRRAGEPFAIDLDEATTLAGLIDRLGMTPQDVHLVILNGRVTHDHAVDLKHGDRIGLFPAVGGG